VPQLIRDAAATTLVILVLTGCRADAPRSESDPQPAALPPTVTIEDAIVAQADHAASEGRYDDAVALMEPATTGGAPRVVTKLAELLVRAARPADAIARLEPLAATYLPARLTLARTLLGMGDAGGALRALDGTVEDTADVHEIVGRARLAAGDVAGARAALARAVTRDSKRFRARLELAPLAGQETVGDVLRAWTTDAAARVEAAPRDPARRIELARVHALAGRRAEAARAYAEALALSPTLPAANLELALFDLRAGREDDAVPRLERVVRCVRRHRQANALLAEHYEGRHEPAKAIAHLEAAHGATPPLDVRLRVAWLHAEAGHMTEAFARAQAAVREAPRSAAAHATLARLYLKADDAPAAWRSLETALALEDPNATPYLAAAYETLGSAYRQLGRGADAAAALGRATDLTRSASVRSQ
jgi:tetratricopeptide (TPR) repeat protein